MQQIKLNTSVKHHLLVALIIGAWLSVFLIVIAPFDIADLPFKYRLELMPQYGILFILCYALLIPIQNRVFKKTKTWTFLHEISFILIFNIIGLLLSFKYYKSDFLNGDYSFSKFSLEVYLPIFFILLTIIVFARWFINKKQFNKSFTTENQIIILKGDNKLDVLQLNLSDLVCVSSADNYVEISYLKDGVLQKKLLRNTIKNIQKEQNLLKVHRAHLINPVHFKEFKNQKIVVLTQTEVPVSKNYTKAILELTKDE